MRLIDVVRQKTKFGEIWSRIDGDSLMGCFGPESTWSYFLLESTNPSLTPPPLCTGGGSSMDVAKLVAFLSLPGQKQKLQDLYGVDMCKGPRLPLIQIPTTAGTGSEVTPIAIITTGAMEKKGVVSSQLLPDMALLDAALTISLPKKVTGMTGLDAMVHAIEAMTSRVKKNRLSNMFAREALSLLGDNILRVTESEEGSQDLIARENMLLGSMYAGMAFANAPVGAVHALAYPVGTLFHVPHGLSISLVLPAVLRFNIQHGNEETKQAYAHCAKMLFPEVVSQSLSGTSTQQAKALVIGFEMLATRLGLETKLSQMGIQQKDVEQLALDTMKQTRLLPNNPCDVRKEDAVAMFNEVL